MIKIESILICTIDKAVDILERNSNGWYKVKHTKNSNTGWCNSAYLLKTVGYSDSARYAIGNHSVPELMTTFKNTKTNYCHVPYNA